MELKSSDAGPLFRNIASGLNKQGAINEAGLGTLPLLSGFVTFSVLYPMAKSRKLPYGFAIFDRFMRLFPGILAITALEFLWPLTRSGPYWTRVAEFVTDKCERNAWRNLLFINNWQNGIEMVSENDSGLVFKLALNCL